MDIAQIKRTIIEKENSSMMQKILVHKRKIIYEILLNHVWKVISVKNNPVFN